jgi:CRP-like cAMP-binding protein
MNDALSSLANSNRLLSALPAIELDLLRPHLEHKTLETGMIVADPGDPVNFCLFPISGMISLLPVTESGQTIEAAYTGSEGMIGIGSVLGGREMLYEMLVQAETECLMVDSKHVRRLFETGPAFHDLILRYVYALLKQMSQTCVCNHFHTIEARMCRWLTVMCERSGRYHLALTQEFLAYILGVQRTSIGIVANTMQTKGVIKYRRGRLQVLDFDQLKSSACECYAIVNAEYSGLYNGNGRRPLKK